MALSESLWQVAMLEIQRWLFQPKVRFYISGLRKDNQLVSPHKWPILFRKKKAQEI